MINKLIRSFKFINLIKEKIRANKLIKLNAACGNDYKSGWINIDNDSNNDRHKIDAFWDLRHPLPLNENSVDYIYNEHFLEHLTVEEGQAVIKDFLRVLKKGGIMRIAMPDLDISISRFLDPDWKNDPLITKFGFKFKTRAERLNTVFRSWGHKWLYNAEELKRRLKEAGCNNVTQCKLNKSKYAELKNLETRNESTLIMEVIK